MARKQTNLFVLPSLVLYALFLCSQPVWAQTCFQDSFDNLKQWQPFTFRNISSHSRYTINKDQSGSVLQAESNSSASALISVREFDLTTCPVISWRWKVDRVYTQGNALKKAGDDFPMRVYVMFSYEPGRVNFLERMKYSLAKRFYKEYPPLSSINYIWANKDHPQQILPNAYTDKSKMILLQKGEKKLNTWIQEERNILLDYQQAFGDEPPRKYRIAIMNDSDNTQEQSVSWFDDLKVTQQVEQ